MREWSGRREEAIKGNHNQKDGGPIKIGDTQRGPDVGKTSERYPKGNN